MGCASASGVSRLVACWVLLAGSGLLAGPVAAPGSPAPVNAWELHKPVPSARALWATGQPRILWDRRYDNGGQAELAWDAVETTDHGFLLVGITGPTRCSLGCNADGWLLKIDRRGSAVWTKQSGGPGFDLLTSVIRVGDGYLAAGSRVVWPQGRQAWLLKLAENGDLLWEKTYGGSQDDSAAEILATEDGLLLLGDTESYGTGDGKADAWLVKLDGVGNVVWSRTYDLGAQDGALSIAPLGSERFLLASASCTSGCGGLLQQGFAAVMTLDKTGNVIRQIRFVTGPKNVVIRVLATGDSGALLVGVTSMYDVFPNEDVWIVKLNRDTEIEWSSTIGDRGRYDGGFDVVYGDHGQYIISAYSQSYQTAELNFDNFTLYGISSTGKHLWTITLGGPQNDQARSIIRASEGGYLVVGFRDAVSWPLDQIPGMADFWVVRLDASRPEPVFLPAVEKEVPPQAPASDGRSAGGRVPQGKRVPDLGASQRTRTAIEDPLIRLSSIECVPSTLIRATF